MTDAGPPEAELEAPPKRSRKSFRQRRRAFFQPLMSTVGTLFTRALAATWRVHTLDAENFPWEPGGGRLVAMWHGRLLLPLHYHRGRGYQILVSPSGDGELAHAVLRASGYGTLRGSSNKNAPRALRDMLRELRQARTVVITPDGPRGPIHTTNPGLAWLARATGHPIVCVGLSAKRAWHMKSWDRFTIPLPFTRVCFAYGEPLLVPRDADEAQIDAVTERIRTYLLELEQRAAAALGRRPDW